MFLRRFGRPSMMMLANVKETTTGIVQSELNVVPNARKVLIDPYSQTLNEIKGIPEYDECREAVESSTSCRLKVCLEEKNLEKIQNRIGSGKVDELIDEAEKDSTLIMNNVVVVPNAREILIDLYSKTLNEVKGIPEHYGCRKAVESSTIYRLKVCQEEEDLEKIQKRIGSGEVDELIDEAKNDLRWIGEKKNLCKVAGSLLIKLNELSKNEDKDQRKKEREERWDEHFRDYLNAWKAEQMVVAEKQHEWEVWTYPLEPEPEPEPEPEIQPSPALPEEELHTLKSVIEAEERTKKEAEERTKKERTKKEREQRETEAELTRVLLELL